MFSGCLATVLSVSICSELKRLSLSPSYLSVSLFNCLSLFIYTSLHLYLSLHLSLSVLLHLSLSLKQSHHRSSPKSRLCSTLDPELMLHPDILPRASTVAMTTEYSFLRTSVPRGPKLGSLGIPAPKDRKSKSSRSGKIHSLADYKTADIAGEKPSLSGISVSAVSEMNTSSVSTLSEISTSSVSMLSETSVPSSENGGNDGNNGVIELTSAASRSTAEKEEVVVGRYPSLREVLQAANEELVLEKEGGTNEELESEGGAESHSRRDSFSSTYATVLLN